jgi:hypothetical protein
MTVADFRRIALSLEGAEEGSHMGAVDFRVGGRIFATLASQHLGFGNLMLSPEQQAAFVEEAPEVFLPVAGGWEGWVLPMFVWRRRMRICWLGFCAWLCCCGLRRMEYQEEEGQD